MKKTPVGDLAGRLRKRRKELGFTARFVAAQLQVAPSTYFEWEQGREIKGEKYYARLCVILKMSLAELFTGQTENSHIRNHLLAIEEHIKNIRLIL